MQRLFPRLAVFFTVVVSLSLVFCGNKKEEKSGGEAGLTLDLIFEELVSDVRKKELLPKIETYQFEFYGKFGVYNPDPVLRKKYRRYVFTNIPYDERLEVSVRALDINGDKLCHGKNVFSYRSGKNDRVFVILHCPDRKRENI